MIATVNLQSKKTGEINKFLSEFYNTDLEIPMSLKWVKEYENPIEISELIAAFIDNIDSFDIHMWISIDKNIFINITEKNGNSVIKYLFERYPY